jgi:hypothetical protein
MPSLADIVRRHGPEYLRKFGARMPADQRRALRDIARCRTPALGGQRWQCPRCGQERFSFHSCGNRHCPACGADDARQWLDRQQALLLPVEYHLATFTLPEALRRPLRAHPRELLALLFQTSASTLLDLCANPRWFGATPGVTAVLHTWTRQLEYHPHVHFLVTGGGLDRRGVWRQPQKGFLVPVHALSRVFRARFRDTLQARHPEIFATIPSRVWSQPWVVHSKPVGSGEHALRYLARYIHRVALSNRAILAADDQHVRLRFRRSEDGRQSTCALPPVEFLRRFLQHVLPRGFVKVRSYGLHHPRRRAVLPLLRAALCLRAGRPIPALPALTPPPPCRCRRCQTIMVPVECLRPVRSVPTLFRFDPPARGPPP